MRIFIFMRSLYYINGELKMEFNWNLINDVPKDLSIEYEVKPENEYVEVDLDEY